MFALLEERRHRDAYERGYALCMKHFARAIALAPSTKVRDCLLDVQAAKLAVLQWELEEYPRKRSWSARPETKESEQTAPRRAVRRFSGCWDMH